jgi:transcriptional regulator NrdR family protein
MAKKCFIDVYWFRCPACNRNNHQKAYVRLADKEQMEEIRRRGMLTYKCHHCARTFNSQGMTIQGMLLEVPEQEALAKGLTVDAGPG